MPVQFEAYEKLEGAPYGGIENRVFSSLFPQGPLDIISVAVCVPNDGLDKVSLRTDSWLLLVTFVPLFIWWYRQSRTLDDLPES